MLSGRDCSRGEPYSRAASRNWSDACCRSSIAPMVRRTLSLNASSSSVVVNCGNSPCPLNASLEGDVFWSLWFGGVRLLEEGPQHPHLFLRLELDNRVIRTGAVDDCGPRVAGKGRRTESVCHAVTPEEVAGDQHQADGEIYKEPSSVSDRLIRSISLRARLAFGRVTLYRAQSSPPHNLRSKCAKASARMLRPKCVFDHHPTVIYLTTAGTNQLKIDQARPKISALSVRRYPHPLL